MIYKWLDNALDIGISEPDFWNMTLAELERRFDSYKRIERQKAQEKATFDYLLADLIGKSISRIYSSANNMPAIAEVYPSLFNSEEIKEKQQQKKAELSVLRFKQYADFHNKKFKKEVVTEE